MNRRHSRNSRTTKKIEYEKAQEQIKETVEPRNKHQSETNYTIDREINELRMKI
jgi:hypothetical protein